MSRRPCPEPPQGNPGDPSLPSRPQAQDELQPPCPFGRAREGGHSRQAGLATAPACPEPLLPGSPTPGPRGRGPWRQRLLSLPGSGLPRRQTFCGARACFFHVTVVCSEPKGTTHWLWDRFLTVLGTQAPALNFCTSPCPHCLVQRLTRHKCSINIPPPSSPGARGVMTPTTLYAIPFTYFFYEALPEGRV